MRYSSNAFGFFFIGLGIGAVLGVAMNRWMENGTFQISTSKQQTNEKVNLDREDIAKMAEQFIQADEATADKLGQNIINSLH